MLSVAVFCLILLVCQLAVAGAMQDEFVDIKDNVDRLGQFYARIKQPDAIYCKDRTKMLPACTECIPGLEKSAGSSSCDVFIASSRSIRDEIRKLVIERFGTTSPADRTFGLYPCKLPPVTVPLTP